MAASLAEVEADAVHHLEFWANGKKVRLCVEQ